MTRRIAVGLVLALLGACGSPETDFVGRCEASGMKRELCDCLMKRLPADARDDFFRMPKQVEPGLYAMPKGAAPALSCFDVGISAG